MFVHHYEILQIEELHQVYWSDSRRFFNNISYFSKSFFFNNYVLNLCNCIS